MAHQDQALVKLDAARAALAECRTVIQAKKIVDVAEIARIYLERTQASVETVNRATEIRLLAERQMGEFLKATPKAKGVRMAGQKNGSSVVVGVDRRETLSEIGLTKDQSAKAQQLAAIPLDLFGERLEDAKASGKKLTRSVVTKAPAAPKVVFTIAAWRKQAEGVLAALLREVPADQRIDAVASLAELFREVTTSGASSSDTVGQRAATVLFSEKTLEAVKQRGTKLTEQEVAQIIDECNVSVPRAGVPAVKATAEIIYGMYPRKIGKVAALKAIAKAAHVLKDKEPSALTYLLERTRLFSTAVALWPKDERQYCPHPATWFNQGRYDDDVKEWSRFPNHGKGNKSASFA